MADIEEEVWRLPGTVKGQDVKGGGSHRPPSLSSSAKARLARIVRRAPEVMVKVTGRARGVAGLKAHLDYVTRNGKLTAETRDGELIRDRASLRHLHDDWLMTNSANARGRATLQGAQSVGVILSMEAGTPRDRVQDAARTWARETFGDRHDWIMVRHDDKDHPHVHVTVRAVGSDGKRLAPGPKDLQEWRERFARELRRLGVEAEATPRQARGKAQRSDRDPVHQAERRGVEPKVRQFQKSDATKVARRPKPPDAQKSQQHIQKRQESIRDAYLEHAATLANGDQEDKRLARDIQRFVAELPVPLTRRQRLAVELRYVLKQRPAMPAAAFIEGSKGMEDTSTRHREVSELRKDEPKLGR